MFEIIVNESIKLAILIFVFVIGKYIIPFIKTNVDFKQLSIIQCYAAMFVASAEKIFEHGENDSKLKYATTLLSKKLQELGINLTSDEIRSTIEDAVRDLNK